MTKIANSVFRNMTIGELYRFLELWEGSNLEFWDLVDLYRIDD